MKRAGSGPSACIAIPDSIRGFGYVGKSSFLIADSIVGKRSELDAAEYARDMTEILPEVDGILKSNKRKNNPTIRLGFSAVAFYELYNMEHEQAHCPREGGRLKDESKVHVPRGRLLS